MVDLFGKCWFLSDNERLGCPLYVNFLSQWLIKPRTCFVAKAGSDGGHTMYWDLILKPEKKHFCANAMCAALSAVD